MNIVIVQGNGFDLDLGWDTSYKSFYEKHKGWEAHKTDEDDLFQYVIKQAPGNWFDFERTLHEYALHRAEKPYPEKEAYKTGYRKAIDDFLYHAFLEREDIGLLAYNEIAKMTKIMERYIEQVGEPLEGEEEEEIDEITEEEIEI